MFNQENKNKIHSFYIILCLISVIVVYYTSNFLDKNDITIPFVAKFFKLYFLSIPSTFGLLFLIFNKWLWKWWSWFGLINFPNLNGKWEGHLKTSYDNFKSEIKATLEIKQTASTIKVKGIFNQSKSISICETFAFSEIDQSIALYFFYKNDPNQNEKQLKQHEGAMKLIYEKDKKLSGYYWTGKDRQTYGVMEFNKQ